MEFLNTEQKELIYKDGSFDDRINGFKIHFFENQTFYCSIEEDADKDYLRSVYSSIKSILLLNFGFANIKMVSNKELDLLFIEKAVEIFKAKNVLVSLNI